MRRRNLIVGFIVAVLVLVVPALAQAQIQDPNPQHAPGSYAEHTFPDYVSFSSGTSGTTIKYGFYDEIPSETIGTTCQNPGPCAVPILNRCGTNVLNVIAFKYENGLFVASDVVHVEYDLFQVPADEPLVQVNGGYNTDDMTFGYGEAIEIHMISPGGNDIRYTTDGEDPYPYMYGNMCEVDCFMVLPSSSSTTIKLNACRNHCSIDPACSDTITINYNCVYSRPIISPSDEYYFDSPVNVQIEVSMGEIVRYTVDGTDPVEFGIEITSAFQFTLNESATVRAVGKKDDCGWSNETTRHYTIAARPNLDPPAVALPSGQYSVLDNNTVSITSAHETHYTLDGSFPNCNTLPLVESNPEIIQLPAECGVVQLKAVSCSSDHNPPTMSETVEYNYELVLPAPTVSHEPGVYTVSFDLSFSESPDYPFYYYTCDGSEPWLDGIGYPNAVGGHFNRTALIPIRESCDLQLAYSRPSSVSPTCGQHSEVFSGHYDISDYSWRAMAAGLVAGYSPVQLDLALDVSSSKMGFTFTPGDMDIFGGYYVEIDLENQTSSIHQFYEHSMNGPPQLFILNGNAYVVYLVPDGNVYCKMWNGSQWTAWPGQTSTICASGGDFEFDAHMYSDDGVVHGYLVYRVAATEQYRLREYYDGEWYDWLSDFGSNVGTHLSMDVQANNSGYNRLYFMYAQDNQSGGEDVVGFYVTTGALTAMPTYTGNASYHVKSLDIAVPVYSDDPSEVFMKIDKQHLGQSGYYDGETEDVIADMSDQTPSWAPFGISHGYSFPTASSWIDDFKLKPHPWGQIYTFHHLNQPSGGGGAGFVQVYVDDSFVDLECTYQENCYRYLDRFVESGNGRMDLEFVDFGDFVITIAAFVDTRHDGGVTIRMFDTGNSGGE